MTAPLLNTICSSSPCSRMASRTSFSFGSQVATMDRPTESGVDALLAQGLHQLWRGLRTERGFLFCGGIKKQRSVLRDHAIEKINPGKDAHKIRQLAPSDEEKPPAGSPEGYERVCGRVVDNAVMRERAVVVGRQTADVHGAPAALPDKSRRQVSRQVSLNAPATVTVPTSAAPAPSAVPEQRTTLKREQRAFFPDLFVPAGSLGLTPARFRASGTKHGGAAKDMAAFGLRRPGRHRRGAPRVDRRSSRCRRFREGPHAVRAGPHAVPDALSLS